MAEVRFGGGIDRKLYVEAQRLHMRPRGRSVALIVLVVLMMGYGVIGVPLAYGSRPSAGAIAGFPAFVAFWAVLLLSLIHI